MRALFTLSPLGEGHGIPPQNISLAASSDLYKGKAGVCGASKNILHKVICSLLSRNGTEIVSVWGTGRTEKSLREEGAGTGP